MIIVRFVSGNVGRETTTYIAPFDFELVVDTRSEIVQHDHFTVGRQAVLLLDPDPNERFDGSAAGYAAHSRRPDCILIVGC